MVAGTTRISVERWREGMNWGYRFEIIADTSSKRSRAMGPQTRPEAAVSLFS